LYHGNKAALFVATEESRCYPVQVVTRLGDRQAATCLIDKVRFASYRLRRELDDAIRFECGHHRGFILFRARRICAGDSVMNAPAQMSGLTSVDTRRIDRFEELGGAVQGVQIEVLQLQPGRLSGHRTHMLVGGMPLSTGAFSLGVRTRGVLSNDRVTIGMLTSRADRATLWSHEMHPADVLVIPAGEEHDGRFHGGASYAVISLDQADIASSFGTEARLRELGVGPKAHFRADSDGGAFIIRCLGAIVARLEDTKPTWDSNAAAFWKRSIIEVMTGTILLNHPSDRDGPLLSARRIVDKVEDYIEATGLRPVHISEICSAAHVSRRTLHRAFYDAIGIGPVAFLRCRRLCCVHSVLRSSDPATTTIADVAMDHGFLDLGRFSGYYHALFDEYPSETLAKTGRSTLRRRNVTALQRLSPG
jgi:AraC-like DNA-binding protein